MNWYTRHLERLTALGYAMARSPLRYLGRFVSDIQLTIKEYLRLDCMRDAAAISYYAILSFFPFLLVLLMVLSHLLWPVQVATGQETADTHSIVNLLARIFPFSSEQIATKLQELVEHRSAIGFLGVIFLIVASSLVFSAIEVSLDRIWGRNKKRKFVISKLLFLGFVGSIGIMLVLANYLLSLLSSLMHLIGRQNIADALFVSPIQKLFVSYGGTCLFFAALVLYFSKTRIRFSCLVAAATLFWLLWELAMVCFELYLTYVARLDLLYGSLSSLVISVLWVFYAANIFLLSVVYIKILSRRVGRS